MDGLVGLLSLGIALAAVGLVDLALFRGLTADYLTLMRRGGNRVALWGALALGGVALLVLVLGAAVQNYPEESPTRGGIVLIVVLIGLVLGLAFLVGYGATAWSVGERVLQLFGVVEPHPGWCVLTASLLIPSVVWIPVFGWALGLYWVASTLGAMMHRALQGSPPAMPAPSGE